jgi:hypothetical protein
MPGASSQGETMTDRHAAPPGDIPPSLPRRETIEDCIRSATTAPSLHNSQPWLFRIGAGVIDVYADRRRQLEVLDPTGRELLISVGAAVLTLAVFTGLFRPHCSGKFWPLEPLILSMGRWVFWFVLAPAGSDGRRGLFRKVLAPVRLLPGDTPFWG